MQIRPNGRDARSALTVVLAGALVVAAGVSSAAPAHLDKTFGNGGKRIKDMEDDAFVYDSVVQRDGKIVEFGSLGTRFLVLRYKPNGDPDTSFGGDGVVTTPIGQDAGASSGFAYPDGRVVAVGYAFMNGVQSYAITRYLPSGKLDDSFGGDGKVTTSFTESLSTTSGAQAVLPLSNGVIFVGGTTGTQAGPSYARDFSFARYKKSGKLDPGLDSDGKMLFPMSDDDDLLADMARGVDGSIVAVGRIVSPEQIAVAVIRPNGTPVNTFDNDGKLNYNVGPVSAAQSVVIRPNGNLIVGGRTTDGTRDRLLITELTPQGAFANSFEGDGIVVGDERALEATSLALQVDGKLVSAGPGLPIGGSDTQFLTIRLRRDGVPDPTWSGDGYLLSNLTQYGEAASAVAIGRDNKIVVAGTAYDGNSSLVITARFLSGLPPGCTIAGTPGSDVLEGTSGRDVVCGLGGSDELFGLGDRDLLRGGEGSDKLRGGAANDRLFGDAGADKLLGNPGDDLLNGGRGTDDCRGGTGADSVKRCES
jgi:uncharacterized delta-60 repeat protein